MSRPHELRTLKRDDAHTAKVKESASPMIVCKITSDADYQDSRRCSISAAGRQGRRSFDGRPFLNTEFMMKNGGVDSSGLRDLDRHGFYSAAQFARDIDDVRFQRRLHFGIAPNRHTSPADFALDMAIDHHVDITAHRAVHAEVRRNERWLAIRRWKRPGNIALRSIFLLSKESHRCTRPEAGRLSFPGTRVT